MLCKSRNSWLSAAAFLFAAGAVAEQEMAKTPAQEGAAAQRPAAQASPRRALFEQHRQLEEKLAAALVDSADAARAFGKLLPAGDRRRLQAACSSLARNPDGTAARELLREFIQHHRDQRPRVILRYCLDPSLHQLQQEVRATRRALQEGSDNGGSGEFDFRFQQLERAAREERRRYAAISGILLAKQDPTP